MIRGSATIRRWIEAGRLPADRVEKFSLHRPDDDNRARTSTVDGDKVWARLIGRGTHRGPFLGLSGTGKTITVDVIDIGRFENGKLVEHWGVPDRFSMLEQSGLLPKPQPPAAVPSPR